MRRSRFLGPSSAVVGLGVCGGVVVVVLVGRDYPSALADLLDPFLMNSSPLVALKVRAGLEAFVAQGAVVRSLSCKSRFLGFVYVYKMLLATMDLPV